SILPRRRRPGTTAAIPSDCREETTPSRPMDSSMTPSLSKNIEGPTIPRIVALLEDVPPVRGFPEKIPPQRSGPALRERPVDSAAANPDRQSQDRTGQRLRDQQKRRSKKRRVRNQCGAYEGFGRSYRRLKADPERTPRC